MKTEKKFTEKDYQTVYATLMEMRKELATMKVEVDRIYAVAAHVQAQAQAKTAQAQG